MYDAMRNASRQSDGCFATFGRQHILVQGRVQANSIPVQIYALGRLVTDETIFNQLRTDLADVFPVQSGILVDPFQCRSKVICLICIEDQQSLGLST